MMDGLAPDPLDTETRVVSRVESRRWNAPRSPAKRRRVRERSNGSSVLTLLAHLRNGTLPPDSPDALP